jgi:hypothetical protein
MTETIENKTQELMEIKPAREIVRNDGPLAMFMDSAKFSQAWRASQLLASSSLIPQYFQGQPANVFIALQLADRMGLEPFGVMQSLYIVHGRPGWEAKFVIALINSSRTFKTSIQWRLDGEGMQRQCTAYATRHTGELCEAVVSMEMAKAEGWLGKAGSKWITMPEQMLRYRSAMFLARLYCPEVVLGLQAADELEDTTPVPASEVQVQVVDTAPVSTRKPRAKAKSQTDAVLETLTQQEPSQQESQQELQAAETHVNGSKRVQVVDRT